MSLRQNIVLIGFMGTGKSSIGRQVAQRLGFQFVDMDSVIVERAGMEIPEIFQQHGEPHFRALEEAALESLQHLERCVIATGGGVVLRESNRELLQDLGFVVLLTADDETIFERVSRNARRPLLQTENPRETMTQLLAERRACYESAAQWSLDTSQLSHAQAAEAVINEARAAFAWHSGG